MKWIKNCTLLILVIVSFIGTIGVNVFQHSCSEDGVYTAYFINTNAHCEPLEPSTESCCEKERKIPSPSKQAISDNCCTDEVSYFKASLDYFSSYKIQVHALNTFVIPVVYYWNESFILPIQQASLQYEDPPPLLKSGREILLNKQVFRL